MELSAILKAARKDRKLTMMDAAEKTKIPLPIYRMIERGKIIPDRDKAVSLYRFYFINLNGEGRL
jgi:transcriptional regulator with XRE-family HTH domain